MAWCSRVTEVDRHSFDVLPLYHHHRVGLTIKTVLGEDTPKCNCKQCKLLITVVLISLLFSCASTKKEPFLRPSIDLVLSLRLQAAVFYSGELRLHSQRMIGPRIHSAG